MIKLVLRIEIYKPATLLLFINYQTATLVVSMLLIAKLAIALEEYVIPVLVGT
jgi:hypothetical protein